MGNIYEKATDEEYKMIGQYVRETSKIKRKLYIYTALFFGVLVISLSLVVSLVPFLVDDITNGILGLIISVWFLLIILVAWGINMKHIRKINRNYEEGKFSVLSTTIMEREKITRKRGIILNSEEDYSEGYNRFYLMGRGAYGTSSTYRVSGKEYEKSKLQRKALIIFWEDESGFYGECDLMIR